MHKDQTLGEYLRLQGVSRRGFLKYCSATASLMALPPSAAGLVADALATARRPSVIWLSFQECTGCTESLTRSHAPTVESLIFDAISLDYHHTLQAAAGHAAEDDVPVVQAVSLLGNKFLPVGMPLLYRPFRKIFVLEIQAAFAIGVILERNGGAR